MANLGTLSLDLIAKIGGFTGPMDKASRETQKRMKEIEASAKKAGAAIGIGFTAAAGVLTLLVKQSIDAADAAKIAAQSTGLTVEAYTSLQYAASLSALETEKFNGSMVKLSKAIGDVGTGNKETASIFKALGVSVVDASGNLRTGDAVLMDLADRFAKMPDGVDKTATAIKVFGKAGADMIPLLNSGSEGIKEMTAQAQKLGLVLSDEQASAAENFNDSLTIIASVSRGFANDISEDLLPTLNSLSGMMIGLAEDTGTASGFGAILNTVIKGTATVGLQAATAVMNIGRAIGGVAAAASLALTGEFKLAYQTIKSIGDDNRTATEETNERIKKFWGGEYEQVGKKAAATANIIGKAHKIAADDTDALRKSAESATKAIDDQIKALQFQAETVGWAAEKVKVKELADKGATPAQLALAAAALNTVKVYNDQADAAKKAADASEELLSRQKQLMMDLRSEGEKLADQTSQRISDLKTIKDLTPEDRSVAASKILESGIMPMPKFGGVDPMFAGPQGEVAKIDAARETLKEWYDEQITMLEDQAEKEAEFQAEIDAQKLEARARYLDELGKLDKARDDLTRTNALETTKYQLQLTSDAFDVMADIVKNFAGESSGAYKAMFAMQKMFAVAMIIANTEIAAAKAPAELTVLGGIPVAAMIRATGYASAAMVGAMAVASTISGQAHDGIMSIPEDGTWNLKKGERVTTGETSAKLDRTLDSVQKNQMSGSAPIVNLYEDKSKAGAVETRQQDNRQMIDIWVADLMGDGKAQKAMTRKFGLQPVGV